MTLENSRVLYKHFLEIGDKVHAEQQLKNYPELAEATKEVEEKEEEAPNPADNQNLKVKKNGNKKRKR